MYAKGPTRQKGVELLRNQLHDKPLWLLPYVDIYVDAEIAKFGGLGNYTIWHDYTKHYILGLLNYEYRKQLRQKTQDRLRKWFVSMKVYGRCLKMYIYIHCNYVYRPNEAYYKSIQEKYRPIFRLCRD